MKNVLNVTKIDNNEVIFSNGGIGFLKRKKIAYVKLNNKDITSEKFLSKYVKSFDEYKKQLKEEIIVNNEEKNDIKEEIIVNNEEKNDIKEEIIVNNEEKFDLFDNILEPPINRDKMNKFIDNFKCDFPILGKNYNIIIDDTCTARKHYDEKGNMVRYTVFTMTCDSKESLELSMLIKSNMWALMSQYLKPYIDSYGLQVDLNDRITDTEVRSDLVFPYVKGLVSPLRKYVHIAYFLAKKEIKEQYREKIIENLNKDKKNEKIS